MLCSAKERKKKQTLWIRTERKTISTKYNGTHKAHKQCGSAYTNPHLSQKAIFNICAVHQIRIMCVRVALCVIVHIYPTCWPWFYFCKHFRYYNFVLLLLLFFPLLLLLFVLSFHCSMWIKCAHMCIWYTVWLPVCVWLHSCV